MKLILKTTQDLPEETFKEFAIADERIRWTPEVLTTDQSPNILIENPETYIQAIDRVYFSPLRDAISKFNMRDTEVIVSIKQKEISDILFEAKQIADKRASDLLEIIVE